MIQLNSFQFSENEFVHLIQTLTVGYVFFDCELCSPVRPPWDPFSLLYLYLIRLVGCSTILKNGPTNKVLKQRKLGERKEKECKHVSEVCGCKQVSYDCDSQDSSSKTCWHLSFLALPSFRWQNIWLNFDSLDQSVIISKDDVREIMIS